jgi:hypothetical protein
MPRSFASGGRMDPARCAADRSVRIALPRCPKLRAASHARRPGRPARADRGEGRPLPARLDLHLEWSSAPASFAEKHNAEWPSGNQPAPETRGFAEGYYRWERMGAEAVLCMRARFSAPHPLPALGSTVFITVPPPCAPRPPAAPPRALPASGEPRPLFRRQRMDRPGRSTGPTRSRSRTGRPPGWR